MKKEGDIAVYECFDSPTFLVNGEDTQFNLTCQKTGFPDPLSWPTCIDPSATTPAPAPTPIPKLPCQCIGDKGVDNEKLLELCRDPDIPGNVVHYAGFTPPSRKKCGNRSPEAPTKENHCFCATVEAQARKHC